MKIGLIVTQCARNRLVAGILVFAKSTQSTTSYLKFVWNIFNNVGVKYLIELYESIINVPIKNK